jgi:anti-sigma regulatory factor (Ser/Thr protein kinase)
LTAHLAAYFDGQVLEDSQLVVSELVTNAIRHAEGDIELCAAAFGRVLRIEVTDQCRTVNQ